MSWTADRDLYLDNTKTKVVEAGNMDAAWLLCRAGQTVSADLVKQYKLKNKPKARAKAADKAAKKTENKGC